MELPPRIGTSYLSEFHVKPELEPILEPSCQCKGARRVRQLLAGEQSCLQAQVQGAVCRAPPATVARNMMISPPPVVQLATLAADYLCLMPLGVDI